MNNRKIRRVLSLYNAEKKELIGIFNSNRTVVKYLYDKPFIAANNSKYGDKPNALNKLVFKCMATKERLINSRFDYPIAIRESKTEHKDLLGKDIFFITDSYKEPHLKTRLKGMTKNFEERMNREHCRKIGTDNIKNYGKPIGKKYIK